MIAYSYNVDISRVIISLLEIGSLRQLRRVQGGWPETEIGLGHRLSTAIPISNSLFNMLIVNYTLPFIRCLLKKPQKFR